MHEDHAHSKSVDELLTAFGSDYERGLTSAQASEPPGNGYQNQESPMARIEGTAPSLRMSASCQ